MVKKCKLCFNTVHTPNVRLHVPSASLPTSVRQLRWEDAGSSSRISRLSVAAVRQVSCQNWNSDFIYLGGLPK